MDGDQSDPLFVNLLKQAWGTQDEVTRIKREVEKATADACERHMKAIQLAKVDEQRVTDQLRAVYSRAKSLEAELRKLDKTLPEKPK